MDLCDPFLADYLEEGEIIWKYLFLAPAILESIRWDSYYTLRPANMDKGYEEFGPKAVEIAGKFIEEGTF